MDSEKCDKTVINCAISDEAAQGDKISYFIFESVQVRPNLQEISLHTLLPLLPRRQSKTRTL